MTNSKNYATQAWHHSIHVDYWADPVVHLLLKNSMVWQFECIFETIWGGGYFPLCDLSSIFVLILILVAVIGLSMLVDPLPGLRHAVLSTVHSTVFDYIHCFKAHNVHFTLSGAADVCTAAKKIEKVLIFCTQLCATAACGFTANLR